MNSASRRSASVWFKLVVYLASTVALITIKAKAGYRTPNERRPTRFDGEQTRRLGRKLLPCQSGDGSDCDQERWPKSWAGVYVDSVSKEVLHLEAGGGASLSPGTLAADFGRDCLRWTADEDALRLVDCQGRPFTWTGDGGDVRRDSMHAGKRTGFGAVSTTDGDEIFGNGPAHLVRDPFGFVFPGCAYSLSMRQWSQHNTVLEVRVVINHDGSVTDGASGGRVASWSFAGMESLPAPGDESWPAGDAIVLLLDACYQQSQGFAAPVDGANDIEVFLFTSDGGRSWLPVHGRSHAGVNMHSEEHVRPHQEKGGCVSLTLVAPTAVSLLPVTTAMLPLTTYLQENKPLGLLQDAHDYLATGINKLQPVRQVLEAQPFRLTGQHGVDDGTPHDLEAVIVISKAVPRPNEGKEDLVCVINGVERKAVWLSWSMVLCSIAYLRPGQVTLFLSYQGSRFSVDASFLHSPPPRHTRLAWPASESFDIVPAKQAPKPLRVGVPRIIGVNDEQPVDTTLVICTMFKDEAPYLEEWLQYHRLLGVSKVYMYDNGSSDNSRDILKKFELSEFVHVRDWDHIGAQTEALNDCLSRFRHTARWMAFIDIDEFMDSAPGLPIQAAANVSEAHGGELDGDQMKFKFHSMVARRKLLLERLNEWGPKRHTQCMPWVNYCTYGQLSKSPGGITDNYLQLEDMGERKIHMQKPLFKAMEAVTLRSIGPHFLLYATEDIDLQYRRNLRCPYDWLDSSAFRIRHYRSKSLEEYVNRRLGADAAYQGKHYTREKLTSEWMETNAQCGKAGR